jgi:hypothetical protein
MKEKAAGGGGEGRGRGGSSVSRGEGGELGHHAARAAALRRSGTGGVRSGARHPICRSPPATAPTAGAAARAEKGGGGTIARRRSRRRLPRGGGPFFFGTPAPATARGRGVGWGDGGGAPGDDAGRFSDQFLQSKDLSEEVFRTMWLQLRFFNGLMDLHCSCA